MHTPNTFGIKAVKKRKSKCEKVTNKIRILRKPYAYLQIILKAHDVVMFEKDQPKTVEGVARTRSIIPIHFYGIKALKSSS